MRQLLAVCIMLFCLSAARAQSQSEITHGSVKGVIVDSVTNNVDKASIYLINARDTSIVRSTLSDSTGNFKFSNVKLDAYILRISFQGYDVLNKYVGVSKFKPNVDLGDITLKQSINELGTVVVTAVIPMSIKGDTTEFNADAFGTKPNATVEDLLKKLPGVEVDKDGSIKSQGEAVSRVFVDGKRFFGNDPKMATQNLPKDVVDKIQVFDGKSDQSEFSGFDDGNRIKTINIVTKKEKRHGMFGRATAGGGMETTNANRALYNANAHIMRFNGDKRIMFTGQLNNVNQQMFRWGGGNNNGLTKTAAAGLNYQNKLGDKTDFSGSYSFNNTNTDIDRQTFRQNLYGDTLQNNTGTNSSNNRSNNHNFNLNFETKFDSANELRVRPSFSISNSNNASISSTNIDSVYQTDTTRRSYTDAHNASTSDGYNADVSATYRHAFKKKGRTVSLDVQLGSNNNKSSGSNYSDVTNFITQDTTLTDQMYHADNKGNSINTTLSYTEPLSTHQRLQFEYGNSYSKNTSQRTTYNYDKATGDYTNLDSLLTNNYENTYNSNRATLSYMYNDDVFNVTVGSGVQFGKMESNNLSKNIHLSNDYVNIYPTASMTYKFSDSKNLRFNYRGRTNQPGVQQLQPIEDNSNPLYVTSGNPDLKQEFNNTFQLRYRSFDRTSNKSFFAFLNASFVRNNIVNSITRLSNGGQYSKPVNLNGNYDVSGFLNWSFPIKSPKSNVNLSTRASYNRTASLIDAKKNYTYNTALSQRIGWSTTMSENFDINFNTTPAYNIVKYTVSQGNSNGNYYSQSTSVEGTWYTNSGWQVSSNFDYTFYTGKSQGQNVSIPLWNASVSKLIFKDKAGEIKLSVNDLLNENKGVSFTRSDNFIQQTHTNILKRYFLLTFTYHLKRFGDKGKRDGDRQWRGRGMRMAPPMPMRSFGGGGGRWH